jgi:hypothetical protein
MDLILTESQFKKIIIESRYSTLSNYIKVLNDFSSEILTNSRKRFGINLKLLSTWGASVGGLVMPLDNFIRSGNFNLTQEQTYLILVGVASFLFYDAKQLYINIFGKIKREGIESEFKEVLNKGIQLKKAFIEFLNSLNITVSSISELATYSFLIPIISDIVSLVDSSQGITESATLITKRLLASGILMISSETLFRVIKKILSRFR